MPGRKSPYDITYLTPRTVYREGIDAADADVSAAGIPDLRLDLDTAAVIQDPVTQEQCYGAARMQYNARLEIFAYLNIGETATCDDSNAFIVGGVLEPVDTRCHATIRVWAWGGPDPESTVDGKWCLVHEQSILTDTLIRLQDLPASKYRITVGYVSDDCSVDIVEQHTA